ncbi:MAG: FAD-dependent oxidoreductase [Bdellovibrio sp.]|nr:MAG: FAD-dependent oxidoreductase [Bdellovibrio sp.]
MFIIGAGPAGLTAGYLLARANRRCLICESDPKHVGGISRTESHRGFKFDIGGHRFFSKSQEIEDFWTEILGSDLLVRRRSSRIYYRGKFFSYPLRPLEALTKLGLVESIRCVFSYLAARIHPVSNPTNLQDWVTNQFGSRLFEIFFRSYTEKVWGMSCQEISADWAAQRIKGLSLGSAILNAFSFKFFRTSAERGSRKIIKTLIESFRYPKFGPGMMWERAAEKFRESGGFLNMGCRVTGLTYLQQQDMWKVTFVNVSGDPQDVLAKHVISAAPLREIIQSVQPSMASRKLAEKLKYRDFFTVALIVKEKNLFHDNWIYIHEPRVKVGRIQNFKSWSPEMVPDPQLNCYGLEYFCNEGDEVWQKSDADLITLATNEIVQLGLCIRDDVVDGYVVRQLKAYPVYDGQYSETVAQIREELDRNYPNLHLVGRNGMHKYNNQDHAMMTAMLTVRNILAGDKIYDVWRVNQDAEYQEVVITEDLHGPLAKHNKAAS